MIYLCGRAAKALKQQRQVDGRVYRQYNKMGLLKVSSETGAALKEAHNF